MSDTANAYRTVVVGTDGSESSLRAVARAGALAGACGATLVIACAYLPTEADDRELARAQDALRDEAYQVVGSHPAEDTVRTAPERAAHGGGQGRARPLAVQGSPVETLLDVVRREKADLLVVGNRGLAGIKGRLLGSVPADATRRSAVRRARRAHHRLRPADRHGRPGEARPGRPGGARAAAARRAAPLHPAPGRRARRHGARAHPAAVAGPRLPRRRGRRPRVHRRRRPGARRALGR